MPYIKDLNKSGLLTSIRFFLICLMVVTIVLSLLNLNSYCIVLFVATWFVEGDFKNKWTLLKKDKLFIASSLYILIQFAGIAQADTFLQGWKEAESKLGFFALPLVFCSTTFFTTDMRRKVMLVLCIILTIAALYCLGTALYHFSYTGNRELFFYHQLVSPLQHHAIYFSVYIFIALIFIVLEKSSISFLTKNSWLTITWTGFLIIFLFLLSSKLVLLGFILFLFKMIIEVNKRKMKRFTLITSFVITVSVIVTVIIFDNPVKQRFADMKGNIEILSLEKYNAGMYFNPWEFRLLVWRFTYEIIRDKNAFLIGVGPTNGQRELQYKFQAMGLYAGAEGSINHGYMDYNCHNQFLQSTLEMGIAGLLVLILWCLALLVKAFKKKERVLNWTILIIFAFFFTESVFERQYGMILSTLFPLMYLYSKPRTENEIH